MHLFLLSDVWLLHVDVLFCKCRHQSTVMRLFYSYFLFGVYHDVFLSIENWFNICYDSGGSPVKRS